MERWLSVHQTFSWIASVSRGSMSFTRSRNSFSSAATTRPRQELAAGEPVAGDALVGLDLAEHDAARDDVLGEQRQRHLDVMRRCLDAGDFHRFPPIAPGHTMRPVRRATTRASRRKKNGAIGNHAEGRVGDRGGGCRACSDEMRGLSDYVCGALAQTVPEDVLEKGRHHLLDTLAAMVSGSRLRPASWPSPMSRSLGGTPACTVIGTDCLTNPVNAALANGIMGHADETDDSHLVGRFHPGCGIVAGALAAAEIAGQSGAQSPQGGRRSATTSARASTCRSVRASSTPAATRRTASGRLFGASAAAGRADAVLARAGAPSPVLCRSAGLRRAVLGARRPAYREGVRFRRHDGAQRLVGRHHGGVRIHRCR